MENTVTLQPLAGNISVFYEINLTNYTVLKYKLCLKFVFYKVCVPIFLVSVTWGIVLNNVLSWISLTDHYFPWLHSLLLLNHNKIKWKKKRAEVAIIFFQFEIRKHFTPQPPWTPH